MKAEHLKGVSKPKANCKLLVSMKQKSSRTPRRNSLQRNVYQTAKPLKRMIEHQKIRIGKMSNERKKPKLIKVKKILNVDLYTCKTPISEIAKMNKIVREQAKSRISTRSNFKSSQTRTRHDARTEETSTYVPGEIQWNFETQDPKFFEKRDLTRGSSSRINFNSRRSRRAISQQFTRSQKASKAKTRDLYSKSQSRNSQIMLKNHYTPFRNLFAKCHNQK